MIRYAPKQPLDELGVPVVGIASTWREWSRLVDYWQARCERAETDADRLAKVLGDVAPHMQDAMLLAHAEAVSTR